MTDLPFDCLGPYEIRSIVGRGGMGSVFAADHKFTGERAAVKVLAPALAADQSFRERFIAEIESLKTLNHPNIVKLHGYGEHGGHHYYAMELVDGTSLEQELAAGRRFNWREVADISIDIARALKHAHDHGVIHRDLKPGNLLLDTSDQVKLTDFGIAKLFGSSNVTALGNVLGTADFMAPEHAAGEATTPRCDLYSLGCVMYALLAGRPPFSGKSVAEVVHKVRFEQPDPVTRYAQDVPEELASIISELLEKDPDDRIRTALSVSLRLRAMQQELSVAPTDRVELASELTTVQPDEGSPPVDIAVRPTVCLPADQDGAIVPETKVSTTAAAKKPKKRDHFTRVETDRNWTVSESRSEFSSALPLLLLLLTVLGGIAGGFWYNAQPPTADELFLRIDRMVDPNEPASVMKVRTEIQQFINNFPEDSRTLQIANYLQDISAYELEMRLSVMAKGRRETGTLAAAEELCYHALRAHRQGRTAEGVKMLQGVIELYGDVTEDRIQNAVKVATNLRDAWERELEERTKKLADSLTNFRERAITLTPTDPQRARRIWKAIIDSYGSFGWADEDVQLARQALARLDELLLGEQLTAVKIDHDLTSPPVQTEEAPGAVNDVEELDVLDELDDEVPHPSAGVAPESVAVEPITSLAADPKNELE